MSGSTKKIFEKKNLTILSSASLVYIIVMFLLIKSITSHSYVLKQSDLYKIDTVKLLDRAYYLHGANVSAKGGGIEFEDLNYKFFRIEDASWRATENKESLFDTLQYNGLAMTIYTDKEGSSNYWRRTDDSKIPVIGITIGNKSFINLSDLNASEKQSKILMIVVSSVSYSLFLLIFFHDIFNPHHG